jgi:transcription antitermination factor NusG
MPVMSIKDNPPSKPFQCSLLEKEGRWWVVKVKPRQEKAFAFDLLEQNVDYYLPYYENKTMRVDGKFRKSLLVLFSSYVSIIAEEPYRFLSQNRVVTILPVESQQIFRAQLHYIHTVHCAGYQILPMEMTTSFIVGDTVQLMDGPWMGMSGKVCRINSNNFLILQIDTLGSIRVKISDSQVKLTDTSISK